MLEKLDEIIDFSELGTFIDEPLRTYSAGMKARLGLAVASAIRPNILLIDEVLGVGDPNFREKSKKKILSMVEGASTVVIVSHSFGLMTDVCDRVVLLDHGKIVTIGDPQAAIKAYYDLGRNDGLQKKSHDGERATTFRRTPENSFNVFVPTWVAAHGDVRSQTLENPTLSIFVRRPQFAFSPPEKPKDRWHR